MPKITMREGEHLFIEFYVGKSERLPETLLVEWTGQQAIARVVVFDEQTGKPGCTDTVFEVVVEESQPDPATRNFLDALAQVFGDQVFVMDEHGMRKAKAEGNN